MKPASSTVSPSAPAISVIVPVYNHWHLIPTLLDCLSRQQHPQQDFEILLTDNGSASIPSQSKLPANARILHCERPGSYAARNHAIAHAQGKILAFTDADCQPSSRWLSSALKLFESSPSDKLIVAGAVRIVATGPEPPNAYELFDMLMGIPQASYARQGFGVTANLFVTRNLMEQVGRFDPTRFSGGDADLCHRAIDLGARLVYHEPALVAHPARNSWAEVSAKARRIKGGQICTGSSKKRVELALKSFIPPVFSWAKALSASRFSLPQRFSICAIQARLWMVGVTETLRLVTKIKQPER